MSSNDVPIYASGLSNNNTTNEPSKHKGPHKLPPKHSDCIPVHEISDVKSSKKRKSMNDIMDTTLIHKTSDEFAKEKLRERFNRYYSGKREKGEAHIMNKGKYESRKKKNSHVMKTSNYTYPDGHTTTNTRRSNRLQGSSVGSTQKLIKRENWVVDDFCGTLFLEIVTRITTKWWKKSCDEANFLKKTSSWRTKLCPEI